MLLHKIFPHKIQHMGASAPTAPMVPMPMINVETVEAQSQQKLD